MTIRYVFVTAATHILQRDCLLNALESISEHCPYCGEAIELLLDSSAGDDEYVEDCEVCCRPMTIALSLDEELGLTVRVYAENEAF